MNALDEQAKAIIRGFMNDAKVLRHTPSPMHLLPVSLAHLRSADPALREELAISAPRVIHWAAQNLPIDLMYLPPLAEPTEEHTFIPVSDESQERWKEAAESVIHVVNQTRESLGEGTDSQLLLPGIILAVLDENDVQSCLTDLGGDVSSWRARLTPSQ